MRNQAHQRGKLMDKEFLDIDNNSEDMATWEKIITDRDVNLHTCQFIDRELLCPKFEFLSASDFIIITDSDRPNECAFALVSGGSDPKCELLPIQKEGGN